MLSRVPHVAEPNIPSSYQLQAAIPERNSTAAEDEVTLVTSEAELSSDSSSDDSSEWTKFSTFALMLYVTFLV